MKRKLFYLFSMVLLCIIGTSRASADDQLIVSWNTTPELSNDNTDCTKDGTSNNVATWADGTSAKIMRGDKGQSNGSNITVSGTQYKTIKVSNGAQNKLTMPTGKYAYSLDIYSYVNKATAQADPEGTYYWKEVNGTSYTSPALTCYSDGDLTKPDKASYSLGGVSSFTFNNAGTQLCYVLFITTTPITAQPVSATYGENETPTALTIEHNSTAGTPTFQWYRCDDVNKTNPQAIDGATSASYADFSTSTIGTYYYYCEITDDNDTFASDVATIEVVSASSLHTVTYSLGSATDVAGTVPSAEQASYVTIPTNTSLYKFGYTLTGWNDGTATYAAGDIYTPTADVILTAVFTENTEGLDEFKKDKTVTWYFGKSNGAPDYDGSVTATVQQVKVKNTTVDLGIAMAGGSNEGRTDEWMNNQQKDMMVPVSPGAVVTAKVYYQNNASFNGETITYDEQYGTTGNVVYSYTYTGDEPTSIAVNVGNQFLSYISVTYPGTSVPGANFEDFSAIVNNQTGTLLTQEELVQGTAVSFGIGSGSTRVAANDEDAIAVISGTYHNDHGCTGLNVVVPVPGAVKIGVGQCTYSTSKINVKDGNNTTVISITPAASCWKNDHTKVTYMYYTGDPTTLTINGMSYCPFVSVAAVDLYTLTGSISGGDINGADVVLTSNLTGQEFTATVADGAFTLDVPADTYSISLENAVGYVLSTPTAVIVTAAAALNLTVAAAAEQTVTGAITNAPAEAFALTFTATNDNTHTTVVNCAANATSFEAELMPDTYTISSSAGTLSTLSQESFQVISSAVTFNIYYPETVPAATQQNITVDNTLATATANNYKSVSDALAAAKAGSVSSPVITLTSGQTYREQVIVDMANVTLKTSGTEKAKITFYYGIGYSYYSLNSSGYYDKDRAMTRNSMLTRNPDRWGCTVKVTNKGNNFKAENIIFENSFNQYYTDEEVLDGVHANGIESITYNRTLTSGQTGYKAADAKSVTERAAAIAFENNPTGCELYNCTFIGSQDTYYTSGRVYNKNCDIQGNTDYIFGGGHIVFDNCNLVIGGYSDKETSAYITAQSGDSGDSYIFRDCTVKKGNRTYTAANLGRDWGGASATVYYFNLVNEDLGNKMSYTWTNMGGGVAAGTANLHIYDFDQTVNANYSTTGSTGANINGLLDDADALGLYAGVVGFLGFTPERIYEDNLVLGESSAYNICRIAASDGVERTVELTRAITADKWATIVLPFAMTEAQLKGAFGENVKVAELTSGTESKLNFSYVTATEANKPYAIKVAAEDSYSGSATIDGVTVADATPTQENVDSWNFVGVYDVNVYMPVGSYFFKDNQIKKVVSENTNKIKPFRAYFAYSGTNTPDAIDYSFDEPTAVENLKEVAAKQIEGKFIVDGQLVVAKNGKLYNAAGAVIK